MHEPLSKPTLRLAVPVLDPLVCIMAGVVMVRAKEARAVREHVLAEAAGLAHERNGAVRHTRANQLIGHARAFGLDINDDILLAAGFGDDYWDVINHPMLLEAFVDLLARYQADTTREDWGRQRIKRALRLYPKLLQQVPEGLIVRKPRRAVRALLASSRTRDLVPANLAGIVSQKPTRGRRYVDQAEIFDWLEHEYLPTATNPGVHDVVKVGLLKFPPVGGRKRVTHKLLINAFEHLRGQRPQGRPPKGGP
jgi:hypothetical protein